MKTDRGRSDSFLGESAKHKLVDLLLKQLGIDIDRNNIELGAGITYFFGIIYAIVAEAVEQKLGLILLLSAVVVLWYFYTERKRIRDKYSRKIASLLVMERIKLEDIVNSIL